MYVSENAETERSKSIYKCLYTLHLLKSVNNRLYTPINQGITSEDRERGVFCIYTYKREKNHNIPGISVSPHLQMDGDKLRHFTWGHWGANSSLGLNIVWQEGPLPDGDSWPKVWGLAAWVLTFIAAVDLLLKLKNLGCQLIIHVFEFLKGQNEKGL